jgi:hypothetical protein
MRLVTRELCIGFLFVGVAGTSCHPFAAREALSLHKDNDFGFPKGGEATPEGNEPSADTVGIPTYSEVDIRVAVGKAHQVLWKGVAGHAEHRSCFTCHNHGIPLLAFATARGRGIPVPEQDYADLIAFSTAYFESNRERFLRGRGPGPLGLGGATDTTGWGLFALEVAGKQPDSTTAAVVEYTLRRDRDRDHWTTWGPSRPPAEGSEFMPTALAVRGLRAFGPPEHREWIAERVETARAWLLRTPAQNTEDRVYRLLGLQAAGASAEEIRRATTELVRTQREDGGWGQTDLMASDAYATGSALTALQMGGGLPVTEPVYIRGVVYLLRTQLDDGSWRVRSRSFPVQPYYESGFPHGRNQFLSAAATAWAATALALACPPAGRPDPRPETQAR